MSKPKIDKALLDKALALEFRQVDPDSGERTLVGYLGKLLRTLWVEEEGFSGKRPFGNSSWKWDVNAELVAAGLVKGSFFDDGCLDDIDSKAADELILAVIDEIMARAR